jgi:multidrug efflux pump subunit AcrB
VGVNDAILLVERYLELKSNKASLYENIDNLLKKTILTRLKPVFLTTLTTVLGLITLAFKDELW